MPKVIWLALLLCACAPAVYVRGPVLHPARVPVRSFPSIWVSGGMLEDDTFLQDRLAAHLAEDGQREVRRVDLAELEPARRNGQIPASTVVVLVNAEVESSTRSEWSGMPAQVCGFYGCFTQFQSYTVTVPELRGEAELTVYEGPSARVLQKERFKAVSAGDDSDEAIDDLIEQLAREIEHAVDVLRTRERVALLRPDVPQVREAVDLMRRGRWDEARPLLEIAKGQLGGLKPKVQAQVWYDLGIARWFAPGPAGLTQHAHDAALRALHWAVRLDAKPLHRRAIERLGQARRDFAMLEQQRLATRHNFALRQSDPAAPAAAGTPASGEPGANPAQAGGAPAQQKPQTAP